MLAIAGGKGGCGKTTTALGLALALARQRRRPLVVDCDAHMPNLDVAAETPARPGVDALAEGAPLPEVAHSSGRFGRVDVVPATPGADVDGALRELTLRPPERPVVLDCPGGAGPDAATPLRDAARAVVVTTPHAPARTDARKTVGMARSLDAPVAGAVVVRADPSSEDGASAHGVRTLATVPDAPGSPLADNAVRASYARLASVLGGQQGLTARARTRY